TIMSKKTNKLSMVRIDNKQQARVWHITIEKLIDRLKANIDNNDIATLRNKLKYNDCYSLDRHELLHRIYLSARLKKADNGALIMGDYNDMLLLSAGPILENERLEQLKQIAKIIPSTVAAFIGSSGQTLKIIVQVTLPKTAHRGNEAEMGQFFRKAYGVASAIYSSLLNISVVPSGINDGSSPVMSSCRISADKNPLLTDNPTPLNINGTEPTPMPIMEAKQSNDNNEVSALVTFLSKRYDFRYNSVRGATEYLDKQQLYWGWRITDLRFINGLSLDAREAGIEARPKDVMIYLNSSRIRAVDPVDDYLFEMSNKWDGHDHIGDLADRVKTDLKQWKQWFRMWFFGMVAQWMGYNLKYGNSIVPLLVAPQGYHKSTFCRQLLPQDLRWGYLDNLKFDNQKQVMQSMVDFLLINIDEFNSISKKTQEGFLKNTIQLASIPLKRPYSRRLETERRRASFIATSNMTDVLSDPSGSRRFFVVNVTSPIDTDKPINYEQLYAQAAVAVRNNVRRWFNDADIEKVIAHNRKYALLNSADIYFNDYFDTASANDPDVLKLTASEIYDYIRKRAGATAVTENLTTFGRYLSNAQGIEKVHVRSGTAYYVKYRKA
ncbi:MAG: VapE domain-containing protein, partial [Prevotella sp.]